MIKTKTLFYVLLLLFLSQNASAFCDRTSTRINITTSPGNVQYITTKSKSEFLQGVGYQISPNTLGLTVSNLSISGSAKANVEKLDKQICASLGTINFKMGYNNGDLRV